MPPSHRDLATVKLSFVLKTPFLSFLASCLSSVSPTEVVKLPVCVGWQYKVPDWQRKKINEHPRYIRPSVSSEHNQDCRQTENKRKKDQRNDRSSGMRYASFNRNSNFFPLAYFYINVTFHGLTQVDGERNGCGKNQCSNKLDEYNELHAETEGAAQISHKHKFHQVVNCTVDPSSTL
jgi:hypothetical protein